MSIASTQKLLRWICVLSVAAAFLNATTARAQRGAPDGEWPAYSGDRGSTKYSPLDQINADNVNKLAIAWRWESPDNAIFAANPEKQPNSFKVTPVMVGGVLYSATVYGQACAINPETGETLWVFDPGVWKGPRPGNLGFNSR